MLDEDGQFDMLADETTESLVEVDGNLQIEMERHINKEESPRRIGECKDETSRPENNVTNINDRLKSAETKASPR